MLVDVATYRLLTGDSTSATADVNSELAEAQKLVEDELGRELENAQRTERMRIFRDGRVYPSCTPITAAGDMTIEGAALLGAPPDSLFPPFAVGFPLTDLTPITPDYAVDVFATITYTGGYTAENCPMTLKREIARAAFLLLHPSPVPAGATAASVGDASVSFGSAGAAGDVIDQRARRALRRYRKAERS